MELIELTQTIELDRLIEEAQDHLQAHRYRDAEPLLREAVKLEPKDAKVLSSYGLCLAHLGKERQRALDACRRAVRIEPGEVDCLVNLGRVYKLSGDHGAAYRVFLKAWRQHPRHPQPAAELTRLGVRKPPVLSFLPRSNWCNRKLGKLKHDLQRKWFTVFVSGNGAR